MLNHLASLSYLVTAGLCLAAALGSRGHARRREDTGIWITAIAIFVGLFAMRLAGGEDLVRGIVRGVAVGEGFYAARAAGQIAALIVLAALGWLGWHRISKEWRKRRGSRSAALAYTALLGMAGFAMLYAVRFISLHALDRILYAGPLRLNWVLEGMLTLVVAGSAWMYQRHCRHTVPGKPRAGNLPDRRNTP